MFGHVFERAFVNALGAEVIKPEGGEVTGDDVARALGLGQPYEVAAGLRVGVINTAALALVFDDEQARDEAVNKANGTVELWDGLLVNGGGLRADAKALIEARPKELGIGVLMAGAPPLVRESA